MKRGTVRTVSIETYGCTMNQADSDSMKAVLEGLGFGVLGPAQKDAKDAEADVLILNTCTVKGPTENKIMSRIRRLKASGRKFVVAGCMAASAERIRKQTGAPIVWPGAIARIGNAVEDALCGQSTEYKEAGRKDGLPFGVTAPIMRISIAEGCTGACSYCHTKLARPGLRSMGQPAIIARVSEAVKAGAKEIQLAAMDTGAYGLDTGTDLPSLLKCINGMDGDFRVRVGMINPDHAVRLENGLLEAMKGEKVYRFLHVPVQSGSEKVVRDMGRKHTVADFERIVARLRKEIPGITIATDIIAGYPTESENDFQATLKLLERVKPDITNVSKFSARPGTRAKELKPLDTAEVKRRSTEASALVRKISAECNQALVGKEFDVLITEKQRDFTGRTPGYKQVVVKGFGGGLGDRMIVKIKSANHGSLFGVELTHTL